MEEVSRPCALGRPLSLPSSYKILPTFVDHVEKLVQSSLSTNTTNAYEKAVQAFQLFWAQFSLQHNWPPTVDQLINLIKSHYILNVE